MKYYYPAIFEPTENQVMVRFPDLKGCVTSGKDIQDALFMAKDALSGALCVMEDCGDAIPDPSAPKDIETTGSAFVTLIDTDTNLYREKMDNRSVRKNVSIPAWMEAGAARAGISLSQTLQEALRARLG